MISGSHEQLQQQFEYTQLKPDCHSWWISKIQSGREDTLEERYAIKFCFKLRKNARETYGMLQNAFRPSALNRASVFEWRKRFKEGRESVRDDERCGLAKRLGLGLLCWGFEGVQEEIWSEEASTLQIGSVTFPLWQCTSPQLHRCHRLFDEMGIKTVPQPPYCWDLAPCDFWLFFKLRGSRYETIEEMKEAVMMFIYTVTQRTSMGYSRSCLNGTARALQPEEITSKGTRVSCVYYQ